MGRQRMSRTVVVAAAALVVALASAAAAYAAKPERVVDFSDSYSFAIDCAEFGDYDFLNLVEGTISARMTLFFDSAGVPVREVWHIRFRETGTNSVTGKSLPLSGSVTEILDLVAGTRTLNGKVYLGTQKGGGTYIQDTGRITMTLGTREVLFRAGPHEGFDAGVDALVCAALATP